MCRIDGDSRRFLVINPHYTSDRQPKHSFCTGVPPLAYPTLFLIACGSGNFSLKALALGGCYIGSMPRKAKPLPLHLPPPLLALPRIPA